VVVAVVVAISLGNSRGAGGAMGGVPGPVHDYDGGDEQVDTAGSAKAAHGPDLDQPAWRHGRFELTRHYDGPASVARIARPVGYRSATEAERLAGRVDDFHGALDPIAQNSRTTSVMSTQEGVDIVSSGGRDLSPAQRALAQDGDVLGRLPGAHA
jgi:hypothetical protein